MIHTMKNIILLSINQKTFWALPLLGFIASLPAQACGIDPQPACSATLTSLAVTPINHTINAGTSQQFTATGTFSDGSSRVLNSGGGTWTSTASMSTARYGLAVGVMNNTLYVAGGWDGSSDLATLEAHDAASNAWTPKASMSTARYSPALGTVNNMLYAVGGNSDMSVFNTVEAYDPATNSWLPKAAMFTRRGWLGVGVVNSMLYAVGGTDSSYSTLATVEAYDATTNSWTPKAAMSTPRTAHAVGVLNGVLYAVGGSNNGTVLSTVEAYDAVTNSWTPKAALSTPRAGLAVGVVNGKLYALGGYNDSGVLTTVETYNPVTNTWTASPSLPEARSALAVGVVGNTLYAAGGNSDGYTPLSTVQTYTPPDEIIWSSNAASVATINSSGLALGMGAGTTTINASSGSVSGSTSLMVTASQPDLAVITVKSSLPVVRRGRAFTFSSTTSNAGAANTTASTRTGLYLSTDATITAADTRVGNVSVASLASGASHSASTRVIAPLRLAKGTYYLGAIADYLGAQAESNESNNSFTGTTIQVK
ncbi:MAG: kelch repeat-containing protein [Gallionellaceae bacterium]|nr:kelch repeat-containing protein [Gallionellaceae bacterium]